MDKEKKIDITIRILTSVITLATVIIGIWQFNSGQERIKEREIEQRKFELEKMNSQATIETMIKFKEMEIKLYNEATSVISYLTVHTDYGSPKYKENLERFWELYWVELPTVETKEVEKSMVSFGEILKELESNNFADIQSRRSELLKEGLELGKAIQSSAKQWKLPGEIQNAGK